MADDRRILTWSLNAGTAAYETDLKLFAHKIYSIGIHEFGVRATGKIYNYNTGVDYFDGAGNHTGVYMNAKNEEHCGKYPGIKFYLQTICFGWDKVKPFLEDTAAQGVYIAEMGKIFDLYATTTRDGNHTPLHWEGIELDIEATLSGEVTTVDYAAKYIAFINRVKNELCIPRGLKLRVNSFAQWGINNPYYYRFHDYREFAKATDNNGNASIDELQLMTYDFAWSGSAPGASTPTFWFKEVGEWAYANFGTTARQSTDVAGVNYNPSAKLTIDKVFFGSAGYGNRWGIWKNGQSGRTITFRNLVGWQNGQYKHNELIGENYVYGAQEFLMQNGYEDPISKNQIMLQHVYDMGNAKYGAIQNADRAIHDVYNEKSYITSYSKTQQAKFTGIREIARTPVTNANVSAGTPIDKGIDGDTYPMTPYTINHRSYVPNAGGTACELETDPDALATFSVNPGAGTHRVIALVSYPWYGQQKIGGTINGTSFSIGGTGLSDYYPFMFKESHWVDVGSFGFGGACDIIVQGELCDNGTIIYGFVICYDFEHNFIGGAVDFAINPQPFKKKDGTNAAIPANYAVAVEMLRQEARPFIIWEDRFAPYVNRNPGDNNGGDALEDMTYFRRHGTYTRNGSTLSGGACVESYTDGISYGHWEAIDDVQQGRSCAYFDYSSSENQNDYDGNSGQLVFNNVFNGNVQVTAEFVIDEGTNAGVRFGSLRAGDGYTLNVNFATRMVELKYEHPYPVEDLLHSEALIDADITRGRYLTVRVVMHNGYGYFFMGVDGGLKQIFNKVPISLGRTAGGACGFYTSGNPKVRLFVLSIASTDRWETMEKFEVDVDGVTYPFGAIDRPGYSYDEYGFLIYSGIDENITRTDTTDLSLDYEFTVFNIPGFQGAKTLTIRLIDAGLWFANFFIGDAQGCSITYAGDAETFNTLMNIAVNDYGAKGIGLWVLGQEDPKLFELVPDVVPPTITK